MSSTLNKIADKLTGKDKEHNNTQSSNYGPHSSAVANKLDPKVDSDLDGRNEPSSRVGGYGNTQANDRYGTTTGPGGITSSDTYTSSTNNPAYNNPASTNYGPHSSNIANTVDPRVDSDRDGRNDPASHVGGRGHTQNVHDGYGNAAGPGGLSSTTAGYGTHHTGTGYDSNTSTTAGPHSSNLANKLDPRVDSDHDGRTALSSTTGGYGQTHTTGTTTGYGKGTHATTVGADSYGTTNPTYNGPRSTNDGPHTSNLLNKIDPRVDSDRDGRTTLGSQTGGFGQSHTTGTTGYASTGTHQAGGYTTHTTPGGYGNTDPTYNDPRSTHVGPHSSNLMNKLDPRVDSDRDGRNDPTSRTGGYGNTQTHTSFGSGHTGSHGVAPTHEATTTGGYTGTNVAHNDPRSTNTGPHSSNLLNKLDPRVDSDNDGRNDPTSRTGGYGQTQTGPGGHTVARY